MDGKFGLQNEESLRRLLMTEEPIVIRSRDAEITSTLTTSGVAEGVLLGGNLDMIATAAGWALPSLDGAILLLEAVNMYVGQVDRQLTMLRKAGHLDGLQELLSVSSRDFNRPMRSPSLICCANILHR